MLNTIKKASLGGLPAYTAPGSSVKTATEKSAAGQTKRPTGGQTRTAGFAKSGKTGVKSPTRGSLGNKIKTSVGY